MWPLKAVWFAKWSRSHISESHRYLEHQGGSSSPGCQFPYNLMCFDLLNIGHIMPQHDEERKAEINSTKVSNNDSVCLLFGDFVVLCLRAIVFLSLVFDLTLNRAKFQLLSLFVQHNLDKVLLFFDLQFF